MIQIKRNNKVFFTLEDFGEGSKLSYQLMDHHYIILKFSTATPVYFEIGDSVEIPDFGYFELTSAYFPKHNESDGYDYEMQMDAYYMSWKNNLCKYRPQHGANETSFKLTTTVGVHMNVILGNLKSRGLTYNGKDFSVDYTTYNNKAFDVQKRFLIEYGSISILDALNAICSEDALNCEWWIDGSIIYLGYCEMEGQTTFEQGVNVLSMSYSESKSTYITRLYAFGSDRNIPKGYFTGADADVTTDGVATDYLMLPNKEVDSDGFYAKDGYLENVNVVKNDKQAIEGVVMFEDEYPKVESAVSSIKTYDSTVDNEDGTKTTQTFWQVASTDPFTNSFKESWIKSNLTLGIKFTSGALMGMEFDVIFKVIDKVNYFEIVANDTYGRTLPDGVMCPNVGNKFFLYNWDATKITDTDLIPSAQLSLFDRAKQYYQKTMVSNSNFTCTMDGDKFYNGGTYDYHPLGEQVKLIHEMFPQMDSDGNHYRNSRIIGMDIKLDIPYDKPEYVVGEKAATSRLGKLEEKVDSITVNGLKIDGSAGVGGSVYVIGVNDITPETDSNVYSARRTKKNLADIDKKFLRKDQKDVAQELITFLKGIKTAGIENYGDNITHGVTELYDVIMSNGFKDSMTAGSGWKIDKKGNAQVESIEVRSYMRVLELVMNRLSAEESEFVFTESGTVETATLNEDGSYTLTMRKKTEKDITPFQQGDILKGVMNDLTKDGTVGANFYTSWMQVKEVNQTTNSIKVAVYADEDTPAKKNFPPCNLMVLHRWGNTIDETRQSCWYISSIEKRIVMLDGVTQPKLVESNYASFYGLPFEMENFKGYDLNHNQPYLYVRGAFLQDVCFIDYLGKVVKQERYRGVWSQEVANSNDPYIVTQTTFDTVYHNNAKWQCNSTIGSKVEPSESTTDWTKLSEGGKGSDGKSAAKAYVTSNDIAIPTDANGIVTEDFQIGNTFSLMVDGKNCTDLQITMDETPATNAFKAQLNQLWLTISSSKGAEFGSRAYTLHFTVTGVLDNVTYSDVVTILVRPNRKGDKGEQGIQGPRGLQGLQGEKGEQGIAGTNGIDGIDGRTSWFHIKYSSVANPTSASQMTETPSTYIGTYVDFTELDSTDPKKYQWHRFEGLQGEKGEQGIPGVGVDGKTTYLHIKYSNDGGKTFTSNNGETVGDYIGVCTDYEHDDPTSVSAYTWSKTKGEPGKDGEDGADGADGALPNLYGYDTKVECLVGHHNVVHTKTGFALALDSISDDDTSSDRYCLLRIKNITAGEGTYSISGYITHGRGGKFEFDCGDVTPQTMYLTANKRTRFEKKFVLPKNSYKHVDFEFFAGGYIVNVEELKIERTDNIVSECTQFVTLAHDSIAQKQNILLDTNFQKTNDRTIWSVFNGDIVENAYNGISAFHYKDSRSASVTTAVEILSQKFVGKLKPSTWYTLSMYSKVKGKVIPYIGSNVTRNLNQTGKNKGADAVLCDEYIVSTSATTNTHQLEESTEYKRHSITFFTAPDLTNADERMYFYIWAQAEIYVTMLKLEECEKPTDWQLNEADRKGEKGNPGADSKDILGPTEWSKDVKYLSGKSNEAYQSLVINPKYPKQMYLCGYTHGGNNDSVEPSSTTSAASLNSCTKIKPWVQVPYQDFVATKVAFIGRGKIENLDITNATIQGTITDMSVKTKAEWDAITNSLVPNADKGLTEYERNFQIVDPYKAGSYFIPTIDSTSSSNSATVYERGPQIVFLPTYNPSTDYDIITSKITTSNTGKKRYNIPKYQIAGTHIRITKGGAPRQYLRWAYLEDAEYDSLWNRNNGSNRNTIRDIYDMGTLICADHKIFKVTDGREEHDHEITGAWYYGDSDYKHGRLSVNGTVARMLWLMPGQTVELVSQIEEIYNKKCLVWSVVNSSDFTAVNVNADLYNRSSTYEPIKFHGESGILDPALAGNANNWEDCFMAHRKIDNLLLGGVTKELPRLFINRNGSTYDNGNPIANFYIP